MSRPKFGKALADLVAWANGIAFAILLLVTAFVAIYAIFQDSRDRLDDIRGFTILVLPVVALATISLGLGILLTWDRRLHVVASHAVTSLATLTLFGLFLAKFNGVAGLPILAANALTLGYSAALRLGIPARH